MTIRVHGTGQINRALKRALSKSEDGIEMGMRNATRFVKNESKKVAPEDTTFMVRGIFDQVVKRGRRIIGRIGYMADYAPIVHEMPDSTNWTKPGSGRKFLERPAKNNVRRIIEFIRRGAKV